MSQIYFELASISKNRSSNFRGFTVYEMLAYTCYFLCALIKWEFTEQHIAMLERVQWPSGRVLDSSSRGPVLEPNQ